MNESVNESEIKAFGLETKVNKEAVIANSGRILVLEVRIIALERALEALLKKEEMSKLNLHGGDGEWY